MKRLLILAAFMAIAICANANRGGFYYDNVRVEAQVHKDNSWDITETFDIVFLEPRHGFYRYIPYTFRLMHDVAEEGQPEQMEWFDYVSDVDDISVPGWEYTTEDSNDEFCIIRIGSANREVTGAQRYVIRYTYTYSDDRRPAYDYLLHTILGTEFEQEINHFEFDISFDKPLPDDIADRLEVYGGKYGSRSTMDYTLTEVTPTSICGEASDIEPRCGITIFAPLPADYYEGTHGASHLLHYILLAITALLIVVIIVLALATKRPLVTKIIEFYPPEGISSAEVGTIIDTTADTIDITSLIPWMAGQGYLKIKEIKEGRLFKNTDLELTWQRPLPADAPKYQQKLMKLLFAKGTVVRMKSIGEHPTAIEGIKKALSEGFKGERKLTNTSCIPLLLLFLLPIFGTLALASNSVVSTWGGDNFWVAAVLFGVTCASGTLWRFGSAGSDLINSTTKKIFVLVTKAVLMLAACFLYCLITLNEYGQPLGWMGIFALFIGSFIATELSGRFQVDTPYRAQMMGRLLGFREFIETAEKPQLEHLQTNDPQYFYRVLPYAMVFGLSDKWANLFRDIELRQPDWYESSSPTPLMGYALASNITHSFASTANNAITTISHSSDSGGGGGFSSSGGGGGFSGGGGGGGGGGSW